MSKKKKKDIIQIDSDFSFEEAMRHLANVKKEDVDETARNESEDAPIEESNEDCEPPQQC